MESQSQAAARKAYELFKQNNILCNVGVSLCNSGLLEIAEAFRQTVDAIDLGTRLFPLGNPYLYSKLQPYHWLSSTMSRRELEGLYENTVKPLRAGETSGIDYIEILETYIANRYNISKTASDIHVHRNTMNHYLEKIQTLIPVDMTVLENMLRIQMGLYAAHILDLERSEAPSSERIDSNAGFTG